jgi:hypothetical protein
VSQITELIRSRGHWQIQLRPTIFNDQRVGSLGELERAFRSAHVVLRGWDYPHEPEGGPSRHKDYIQGTVSWEWFHEVWRLYQSGQFIHLLSLREDWMAEGSLGLQKPIEPGTILDVTETLWTLTEAFLFCARLVESLAIGPDVTLAYNLVGIGSRQLQTLDPRRLPLRNWRKSSPDLHEYGKELTVPVSKLITSATDMAVDQALAIYERFMWEPARQSVVEEQRRLLERRF